MLSNVCSLRWFLWNTASEMLSQTLSDVISVTCSLLFFLSCSPWQSYPCKYNSQVICNILSHNSWHVGYICYYQFRVSISLYTVLSNVPLCLTSVNEWLFLNGQCLRISCIVVMGGLFQNGVHFPSIFTELSINVCASLQYNRFLEIDVLKYRCFKQKGFVRSVFIGRWL